MLRYWIFTVKYFLKYIITSYIYIGLIEDWSLFCFIFSCSSLEYTDINLEIEDRWCIYKLSSYVINGTGVCICPWILPLVISKVSPDCALHRSGKNTWAIFQIFFFGSTIIHTCKNLSFSCLDVKNWISYDSTTVYIIYYLFIDAYLFGVIKGIHHFN